ncbi:MAG: hypothetical protein IKL16_02920 [Clostridia bacterium]|nr:hypothetical protein [Clostridia bacterium]
MSLILALLSLISVAIMLAGELLLVGVILAFLRLHIAEVKQTVQISDETLVCKSFVINGAVADAEIPYKEIEKIEVKRKHLLVYVSGEKPFAIRDNYINYSDLCKALCEKCKDAQIIK